jgi:ADP-ribosyl-[dinitrogen reductase] hydrolase
MSLGNIEDRFRGCLLGLACGDAVGITAEFQHRGNFPDVVDMCGGGPHALNAGEWTDDTSMALCLAVSLVERGKFDPVDQLKRYVMWADTGYLSSTGVCFDIGNTTAAALQKFRDTGAPYCGSADPDTAGNGSIMRLAPVPIFFYPDLSAVLRYSGSSSRTTHAALECIESCRLLGGILYNALDGKLKDSILGLMDIPPDILDLKSERIRGIADGCYLGKKRHEIRTRGYVVETLEAALWCFSSTESFREAVLKAANLGHDADTTAAVCGQIAGAYYGESGIPGDWLQKLAMRNFIQETAEQLVRISPG